MMHSVSVEGAAPHTMYGQRVHVSEIEGDIKHANSTNSTPVRGLVQCLLAELALPPIWYINVSRDTLMLLKKHCFMWHGPNAFGVLIWLLLWE
jgi:hypothetical protein